MTPSRPLAILFDLWGTLVAPRPELRDAVSRLIAADLGVDPQRFAAAVRLSHGERFVGHMGSLAATLGELSRRCGADPDARTIECAAARRLDLTRELLAVGSETLAVLDALRGAGFRLGLVSDSSIEVPTVWSGCPLSERIEATGFSCLLGVRKPAAETYLHVTRLLGVDPRECLYVGDGDSRELTGAAALGMTALRVRLGGGSAADHYDDDADFAGPEIGRLEDLLSSPFLGVPVS